jgi:copper oxidase (laccase) domain-containing protein
LLRAVEGIRERGDSPSDWIAAIGPSIGPCCFEVDEALSERFVSEFQGILESPMIRPRFRHLDLTGIARGELSFSGINHVDLIQVCTRCAQDDSGAFRLHSYRRSPGAGRQVSVVQRIP